MPGQRQSARLDCQTDIAGGAGPRNPASLRVARRLLVTGGESDEMETTRVERRRALPVGAHRGGRGSLRGSCIELSRYLWLIDVAGIALGAVLSGQAAATLIASALPRREAPRSASPQPRSAPPHADKAIDAIIGRNLFCSTCGESAAAPPEAAVRGLRLLAVMFAPPPADRRWSIAVIRNDAAATAGPYAVGATLGDATVEAIDEVRVTLAVAGGRREVLDLLRAAQARPALAAVDKLGARRYRIPRATLDAFLHGGTSPRWPRVAPELRHGKPIGFRLSRIDRDGPFAAIGIESGDLVLEVNGRPIATPDDALAAYAALRNADRVWLVLERDGRRLRMDYDIR